MPLRFLEWDRLEDSDGLETWTAMASPLGRYALDMLDEVKDLLCRLEARLGPAGPLDNGYLWDMELQIHDEQGMTVTLDARSLATARVHLALTLCARVPLSIWLDEQQDAPGH